MSPEAIEANIRDLERIAALELEGMIWKGALAYCLGSSIAYLRRICWLKLKYAVVKYPGPTVTEC